MGHHDDMNRNIDCNKKLASIFAFLSAVMNDTLHWHIEKTENKIVCRNDTERWTVLSGL